MPARSGPLKFRSSLCGELPIVTRHRAAYLEHAFSQQYGLIPVEHQILHARMQDCQPAQPSKHRVVIRGTTFRGS